MAKSGKTQSYVYESTRPCVFNKFKFLDKDQFHKIFKKWH